MSNITRKILGAILSKKAGLRTDAQTKAVFLIAGLMRGVWNTETKEREAKMPNKTVEVKAQEIAESFLNGNRAWAISEVTQAPTKKMVALLAVKVHEILRGTADIGDSASFVRALHNRVVS